MKIKKQQTSNSEVVIYQAEGNIPKFAVKITGETVWLSQAQLVELFQSSKANVSEHIKRIFGDRELQKESVVRNFRTTAKDGKEHKRGAEEDGWDSEK